MVSIKMVNICCFWSGYYSERKFYDVFFKVSDICILLAICIYIYIREWERINLKWLCMYI